MTMEAFPCPSRYREGSKKRTNAANHHRTKQASEKRAPARHPRTSATMKQIERHANPNQSGQERTQKRALAPPGFRKYPYFSSPFGMSALKASFCHSQIKRVVMMADSKGRTN